MDLSYMHLDNQSYKFYLDHKRNNILDKLDSREHISMLFDLHNIFEV